MAVARVETFELKVLTLRGNADDDFQILQFRLMVALWGKNLFNGLAIALNGEKEFVEGSAHNSINNGR